MNQFGKTANTFMLLVATIKKVNLVDILKTVSMKVMKQ